MEAVGAKSPAMHRQDVLPNFCILSWGPHGWVSWGGISSKSADRGTLGYGKPHAKERNDDSED